MAAASILATSNIIWGRCGVSVIFARWYMPKRTCLLLKNLTGHKTIRHRTTSRDARRRFTDWDSGQQDNNCLRALSCVYTDRRNVKSNQMTIEHLRQEDVAPEKALTRGHTDHSLAQRLVTVNSAEAASSVHIHHVVFAKPCLITWPWTSAIWP